MLYGIVQQQRLTKGSCNLHVSGYNPQVDCWWHTLFSLLKSGAMQLPHQCVYWWRPWWGLKLPAIVFDTRCPLYRQNRIQLDYNTVTCAFTQFHTHFRTHRIRSRTDFDGQRTAVTTGNLCEMTSQKWVPRSFLEIWGSSIHSMCLKNARHAEVLNVLVTKILASRGLHSALNLVVISFHPPPPKKKKI